MVDKRSGQRDLTDARRLARECRRFPVCTLLLGGLVLLGVASAVTSILAMSPSNVIP